METRMNELLWILVVSNALYVVLSIGVIVICATTFTKVNRFKFYCDDQFEKIANQVEEASKHTTELTKAVRELNQSLKSVQ